MKLEDLTQEQREKLAEFGVNTWFVMELLENYLNNPNSVAQDWQDLFSSLDIKANGKQYFKPESTSAPLKTGTYVNYTEQQQPAAKINMPQPQPGEEAVQIKGVGERIMKT